MSYIDDEAANLKTPAFEGSIPWLYRDTRGNVTVGVGKMLPTLQAALALPFQIDAPGEAATPEEITVDWNRIMALPFGQNYAAHFYRAATSVFLSDAEITALLVQVLSTCDTELAVDYPDYASLPDCVKTALLDMDYNLGDAKLRKTYPHFDAAVDSRDWLTAAANCHRNGISAARNDWTVRQFQQALALG